MRDMSLKNLSPHGNDVTFFYCFYVCVDMVIVASNVERHEYGKGKCMVEFYINEF